MRTKNFTKWSQRIEKRITKKACKLDCCIKSELVTPSSVQEVLTLLPRSFPYLEDYGVVLSGKVSKCSFYSYIPFSQERLFIRFEIPIRINWMAKYKKKPGPYVAGGKWICEPRNRKKSIQINRRFPEPVVGYFTGTEFRTIEYGGYISPTIGEASELVIDTLCPKGQEARMIWNVLKKIGDVVSFLE